MKQKGWGVPPRDPYEEPVVQEVLVSSRKLVDRGVREKPRYEMTAIGLPKFELSFGEDKRVAWITLVNTGTEILHHLHGHINKPFSVRGGFPKVLRPNEYFKVRIDFEPFEFLTYIGELCVNSKEDEFCFRTEGIWERKYLTYNGYARYNGKYRHGSEFQ